MNLAFGPIIEHDIHTHRKMYVVVEANFTLNIWFYKSQTLPMKEKHIDWDTSKHQWTTIILGIRSYFLEQVDDEFVNTYVC